MIFSANKKRLPHATSSTTISLASLVSFVNTPRATVQVVPVYWTEPACFFRGTLSPLLGLLNLIDISPFGSPTFCGVNHTTIHYFHALLERECLMLFIKIIFLTLL